MALAERSRSRWFNSVRALRGTGGAGFSLVEAMVALGLSMVLLGAFFQFLNTFQRSAHLLMEDIDREQRLAVAPLLLNATLAGAGNRRYSESALRFAADPPMIEAEADLTGPEGFPDGRLEHPYENIAVRSSSGALRLRSSGSGFQPLLEGLQLVEANRPHPQLGRLRLTALTTGFVPQFNDNGRSLEVNIYFWNRRPRLFRETP